MRNSTTIDTNKYPHEKYYIAYVDILGYEELIKEKGIIYTTALIDTVFQRAKSEAGYLSENSIYSDIASVHPSDLKISSKIFSDNFFFCTKLNWYGLLALVTFLQTEFIWNNVFVRGAVHYGNLFWSDDLIGGEGLIDVYKLESSVANFPRIIVSDSFRNKFVETEVSLSYQGEDVSKAVHDILNRVEFFSYDRDYFPFIDYLKRRRQTLNYMVENGIPDDIYVKHRSIYNGMSVDDVIKEEISAFEELLSLHGEIIAKNLQKYKEKPSVQSKYVWCRDFHNNFCKDYGYANFVI